MCGIAGYASLGFQEPVDPGWLEPMLERLVHRGPDDCGTSLGDHLCMGNRRLSIIDLHGGRQPIANEDQSVVVVCNGEIYNYPQLRRELEAKGHRFRTHSDTEVLVHLYEEEGEGFLLRLDGMFGLALHDRGRQVLYLARDRFGVKPLYYLQHRKILAFASEIKALRTLPCFEDTLDPQALAIYLSLFYIPEPWTVYRRVRLLPSGHFLRLDRAGVHLGRFYDFDFSQKEALDRQEAERELALLLQRAVDRQMLSDVPVGVLLSSGMDSCAILAAAADRNEPITSFTIRFGETLYDESPQAARHARRFGSPHHLLVHRQQDFAAQYPLRQRHMDQPFGPWSNTAMGHLSRFIHDHRYKVVLSGAGGDELFFGYPTVHAANLARFYRKLPGWLRQGAIKPLVSRLPAGASRLPASFLLKSFVMADHPDPLRCFFGFKEVIRPQHWPRLLTPEAHASLRGHDPFEAFAQYRPRLANLPLLEALAYLDLKVFLQGCIFMAQDNAFMAASVEQRVPFMDNALVEFACRLPLELRFHPFKLKPLLRRALEGYLSSQVPLSGSGKENTATLQGYRKKGFEIPGSLWLRQGPVNHLVRELLSPGRLQATGFFRPQAVSRLLEEQLARRQNHERVLQAICSLQLFLEGTPARIDD